MSSPPLSPLVWLITGCSSGFGEQFVHQVIARGDLVIASGRNAATKLAHLSHTGAHILDLDISLADSEISTIVSKAVRIHGRVDVLVNNAGFVQSGAFEELGDEGLRAGLQTNFFGPASVTREVLKGMRERGSGTIVFIGSEAGIHGHPSAAGYCTGKFALEGLADCIAPEIAMFGLRTVIFEPGFFQTNALKQGNLLRCKESIAAYKAFNEQTLAYQLKQWDTMPGNPVKGVQEMIKIITDVDKKWPIGEALKVPLGTDGLEVIKKRAERDLNVVDKWGAVARSTDL